MNQTLKINLKYSLIKCIVYIIVCSQLIIWLECLFTLFLRHDTIDEKSDINRFLQYFNIYNTTTTVFNQICIQTHKRLILNTIGEKVYYSVHKLVQIMCLVIDKSSCLRVIITLLNSNRVKYNQKISLFQIIS